MTMVLNIEPELENRLKSEADRRGLSMDEYVLRLIKRSINPEDSYAPLSPEEWVREFEAWVDSHQDWPVLSPEAFERE